MVQTPATVASHAPARPARSRSLAAGLALLAMLGALLFVAPVQAASDLALTAIRFGDNDRRTRIVLDLSRTAPSRVFALSEPARVVIDLPELDWQAGPAAADGAGVVERYRSGVFRPGTSRVVLDLSGPARIEKSFSLLPEAGRPARVVIDLVPDASLPPTALTAPPPPEVAARASTPVPGRKPDRSIPTIVLDPGHGGVDPGAVNGEIYEKTIALNFALVLRDRLEATGRYRVVLTRDDDVYLRLRERVGRARAAGADLFMSLHADSLERQQVRGASVYTLSETASDDETARLAAKENRADVIAGVNLDVEEDEVAGILIDLAMRETKNQSKRFANTLVETLGANDIALLRNTHRFAGFTVLKAPDVPSVLFEIGYLSSPAEARLLMSEAHQARLAEATLKAIDRYFDTLRLAERS